MTKPRCALFKLKFDVRTYYFFLTFDALLIGHDAGITSLSWLKISSPSQKSLVLLSTSVDSSLIIWSPSSQEATSDSSIPPSIWVTRQRFGDVGGQRYGGFVGGLWSVDGKEVMAWGWNGSWRRWKRIISSTASQESWEEIGALTGHQGTIRSVAWAPNGEYLISSGQVQNLKRVFHLLNSSTVWIRPHEYMDRCPVILKTLVEGLFGVSWLALKYMVMTWLMRIFLHLYNLRALRMRKSLEYLMPRKSLLQWLTL